MSLEKIKKPTIEEMLKAGVHFGHQTRRKDPKMDKFVFDTIKRNQIIDLHQTQAHLDRAAEFLYQVAKTGRQIIIVGTKRQAAPVVKKYAKEAGCLFVNQRWLGGTFTNFDSVAFNLKELERIEVGLKNNSFAHYTKKERLLLSRKVEKLEETVGGLRGLKKYPGAVVAIDIKREKTAVEESKLLNIPVVAMVDTNSNPDKVKFIIPANDDAIKSIEIVLDVLSQAIKLGYEEFAKSMEAHTTPTVEAKKPVVQPVAKPVAQSKVQVAEASKKVKEVKDVKQTKELKMPVVEKPASDKSTKVKDETKPVAKEVKKTPVKSTPKKSK